MRHTSHSSEPSRAHSKGGVHATSGALAANANEGCVRGSNWQPTDCAHLVCDSGECKRCATHRRQHVREVAHKCRHIDAQRLRWARRELREARRQSVAGLRTREDSHSAAPLGYAPQRRWRARPRR